MSNVLMTPRSIGSRHGLGAFFWATGSQLDQDFPAWTSDTEDPILLNGTDTAPIFGSSPQLTS